MARPTDSNGHAAAFSRCGRYRWWLSRSWRQDAPALLFIGLNPSSADGQRDDPTLRRLIGFAACWGYGSVEVVNLFAWISPDPATLRQVAEPVGHRTDLWIRRRIGHLLRSNAPCPDAQPDPPIPLAGPALATTTLATRSRAASGLAGRLHADMVPASTAPAATLPLWLGWGNGGRWIGRDQQVLRLLGRLPVRLLCLGLTGSGHPRHPLYAPGTSALQPFGASWEDSAVIAAPCHAPRAAMRSI